MTSEKKSFANKAKAILTPKSISDFLENETEADADIRNNVSTTIHKTVNTDLSKNDNTELRNSVKKNTMKNVRHELQLPADLSEKIRVYTFQQKMTKKKFFVKLLEDFFESEGEV